MTTRIERLKNLAYVSLEKTITFLRLMPAKLPSIYVVATFLMCANVFYMYDYKQKLQQTANNLQDACYYFDKKIYKLHTSTKSEVPEFHRATRIYKIYNFKRMLFDGTYSSVIVDDLKAELGPISKVYIDRAIDIMAKYRFSEVHLRSIIYTITKAIELEACHQEILITFCLTLYKLSNVNTALSSALEKIKQLASVGDFEAVYQCVLAHEPYLQHAAKHSKKLEAKVQRLKTVLDDYIAVVEIMENL